MLQFLHQQQHRLLMHEMMIYYPYYLYFVLLMTVLVLVLLLTGNEGWAALSALVALIPYYIILWLFRDKMREQLAFQIEA